MQICGGIITKICLMFKSDCLVSKGWVLKAIASPATLHSRLITPWTKRQLLDPTPSIGSINWTHWNRMHLHTQFYKQSCGLLEEEFFGLALIIQYYRGIKMHILQRSTGLSGMPMWKASPNYQVSLTAIGEMKWSIHKKSTVLQTKYL